MVVSYDFVRTGPQVASDLVDDHGTLCAGVATASFDNTVGIAGVAPNCHLIGVRLPSPLTDTEIAKIMLWVAGLNAGTNVAHPPSPTRRADVISNSWGQTNRSHGSIVQSCLSSLVTNGRQGKGCVVVFSTGNFGYLSFSGRRELAASPYTVAVGASVKAQPTSPVPYSTHPSPTGFRNNLAVQQDTRALYSPFGQEMDLVAPSCTAYAGYQPVDPVISTTRVGCGSIDGCVPGSPAALDYGDFGGTSYSTPVVAGAAALVLSCSPDLAWHQVRDVLRKTADKIDLANTDPVGQWVDLDNDGVLEFSQFYGFGRVNVKNAVRSVLSDAGIIAENVADLPATGEALDASTSSSPTKDQPDQSGQLNDSVSADSDVDKTASTSTTHSQTS